jgi:DNA primase
MAKPWMDFASLRDGANFVTILARYDLAPTRHQGQVTILCPFHDDRLPSLSVNLDRKLFHCFACQAKGDVLDFVARIEDVSLPFAARIIAEVCDIPLAEHTARRQRPSTKLESNHKRGTARRRSRKDRCHQESSPCCDVPLDPIHPYLFERGLTPELIKEFGLGYCVYGRLRGRICIPVHSLDGARVLGHSGRWANNDVPEGVPKYLMPRGFKKSELLFNYHRVRGAQHIVLVEGYWSVFRLHALQVPAVALMGTSLSETQLYLLAQTNVRRITLLLDADQAGRAATVNLLPRLSASFFVRTPALPDSESPDSVTEHLLYKAVQN